MSPISIGSQNIEGPTRSIILQEVRNTEPLDAFINRSPDKHRNITPTWSKVIGSKTFPNESVEVYARGRKNFGSYIVLSKSPNFMDFGLWFVNTTDELRFVFITTTLTQRLKDGSHWIPSGHDISEATVD